MYCVVIRFSRTSSLLNLSSISSLTVSYPSFALLIEELKSKTSDIKSETFLEKLSPTYNLKDDGVALDDTISRPGKFVDLNVTPPADLGSFKSVTALSVVPDFFMV